MASKIKKQNSNEFGEAEIDAWLSTHPEFFKRYPDRLATMELPDDTGTAVSLHQYQVRVLREDTRQLKHKLNALLKNVKTNHKIHSDLLALAGTLIELARAGKDLNASLTAVKKYFALADIKLLTKKDTPDALKQLKKELGQQACLCVNAADTNLLELIFGKAEKTVLSLAAVPIKKAKRCTGYLVLGSDDGQRFKPGMGGEFLTLLARLVSAVQDSANG